MALLSAHNLVKQYRHVRAVDGLNLTLKAGHCLGLLGPNGAGKTTTIEMLEGIVTPTSGDIRYRGQVLGKVFRQEAGIMFQATALQEFITVRESLQLFLRLYPKTLDIDYLIEVCALHEFLDQDTHKLSGGQRQRLLLAISLVNDPVVLFLDEPTTGLDPQARRNLWQLIEHIKQQDKAILLSTHYMDEAYQLCDEIAIMDHGKIIAQDSPKALLKQHFKAAILQLPTSAIKPGLCLTQAKIVTQPDVTEILTENIELTIRELQAHQVALSHLNIRERTLDDLFLEITGHELRS